MTVQSYRYLGPKQQQVLRSLRDGWRLFDDRPPMLYRATQDGECYAIEGLSVARGVVNGLVNRGLVRHDTVGDNRFGWVLTVRGTLAVTKMKRGRG